MAADIAQRLADVRFRMDRACNNAGREIGAAELVAVSKTFPANAIHAAYLAGQRVFGESKLQELENKIHGLPEDIEWHFIGRVQRNKARRIVSLCDVIHAVDSMKLATHLDRVAGETGRMPRVFLQVNVGMEEAKGGFLPGELSTIFADIVKLPHLQVIGLMCIPPDEGGPESARAWFVKLRAERDSLVDATGFPLTGLSMGMSGDYEVAILEGATHVRVGSSIFGTRANVVDCQ